MRRLRRLIQKRSLRWSEGVCVIEGPDLVEAALDAAVEFEALYVDVESLGRERISALCERAERRGVRVFSLLAGVLDKVADAQAAQPVLAAVRLPLVSLEQLASDGLVLVLHDVRDPGNAGTIIRSADAAGVSSVVFTGQSVDPFNPKTLRATAGSIFHIPVAVAALDATLEYFSSRGVQTIATVVRGGVSIRELDLSRPSVIVIGNEAEGLEDDVIARCATVASIPMAGRSESLNAGVAASLLAFEALWQRQDQNLTPPRPSLEA